MPHSQGIREGIGSCIHGDVTEEQGRCAIISGNQGNIQISNLKVPRGCHGRKKKLGVELAK